MVGLENISLLASLVSVALALVFSIIDFIARRQSARSGKPAAVKTYAVVAPVPVTGFNWAAIAAVFASIIFLSLTIISRTIQTGHGPFSNMYEFAIAFAWGIIVAGLMFRWRYRTAAILNIGLIVSLLLLIFAVVQYSKPASLVPALQQSALLSAHVASAVVAYGTLTIGFGAAILFLVQNRRNSPWLPEAEMLDNISYRAVIIGFPFLTLLIVLGALWADIAWGKYWSWDPKETASLVTWLIYAAYMHARIMRGWRGNRAAILLIAGFAAILLTFFGNYIFSGLHAYG